MTSSLLVEAGTGYQLLTILATFIILEMLPYSKKAGWGLMVENYSDIKIGDVIETYEEVKTERKL